MNGELLHARLVAQDAALGALGRGVDGEDGEAPALLLEYMDAKLVDAGRLAGTRHATDADAHAVAAVGQTLVDDLLSLGLVFGLDALYQRDGLREDGDVALDDALYHFGDRELTAPEAVAAQVGVDDGGLFYAAVDLQAGIFGIVLGVIHIFTLYSLLFYFFTFH